MGGFVLHTPLICHKVVLDPAKVNARFFMITIHMAGAWDIQQLDPEEVGV